MHKCGNCKKQIDPMDDSKVNQVVVPAAAATPNAVLLPGQTSLVFVHALYHFTFILPWNPDFFPINFK